MAEIDRQKSADGQTDGRTDGFSALSLSTVVLRIGKKLYSFGKISCLKINLAIGFTQKNQLECIGKAVMMLYLG